MILKLDISVLSCLGFVGKEGEDHGIWGPLNLVLRIYSFWKP